MSRLIAPIVPALLADENLYFWEFMKAQWGGSIGTKYWTLFPGDKFNPDSIDLDVGNGDGTQTWDCTPVWQPGDFEQGESPLSISDLYIGNADNVFNEEYIIERGGVLGVPVTIYWGFFDKFEADPYITPRDFHGAFPVYSGQFDRAEVMGDWVHISLIAGDNPLDQQVPRRRYTKAWGFEALPPPNFKITFPNGRSFQPRQPGPGQTGDTGTGGGGGGGVPPDIGGTGGGPRRSGTRVVTRGPGAPGGGGGGGNGGGNNVPPRGRPPVVTR